MKKSHKVLNYYCVVVTIAFLLVTAAFTSLFFRENYDNQENYVNQEDCDNKVLEKSEMAEPEPEQKPEPEPEKEIDWTLFSWKSSIEQLRYDADVVFLGDSITVGGDFQGKFKDTKIVNLGISGDTLSGMIDRVPMVVAVKPEKVFVMGGINGLTNQNLQESIETYQTLIDTLQQALPNTEIYMQSVLPIKSGVLSNLDNEHIVMFNDLLKDLASSKECTYIDLFSIYVRDGEQNQDYGKDGIHLKENAYSYWFDEIEKYILN